MRSCRPFPTSCRWSRPSDGILFADSGLDLPGFGLFTTASTLTAKREAIKKLTNVITSAWVYVLDGHVDEAVDAIMKSRPQLSLNAAVLKNKSDSSKAIFIPRQRGAARSACSRTWTGTGPSRS